MHIPLALLAISGLAVAIYAVILARRARIAQQADRQCLRALASAVGQPDIVPDLAGGNGDQR